MERTRKLPMVRFVEAPDSIECYRVKRENGSVEVEPVIYDRRETAEFTDWKVAQAERYFLRIRDMGRESEVLKMTVEAQREMLDGLHGIDYSRQPTGGNDDSFLEAEKRLRESIERFTSHLAGYTEERSRAFKAIAGLEKSKERQCLVLYYMNGFSWGQVEYILQLSHDAVMKLRKRALSNVSNHLPPDVRENVPPAI